MSFLLPNQQRQSAKGNAFWVMFEFFGWTSRKDSFEF